MATLHAHAETSLSAAEFRAALTNFSDRDQRLSDFSNISAEHFEVHEVGDTSAVVTEGASIAGGVWEKLRYDWSDPNVVTLTTIESNTFEPGGTWKYTTSAGADGKTRVDLVLHRVPTTFKGKLLGIPLTLAGGPLLGGDLKKTLRRLEARRT
jgi:hypothetical protein